MDDMDMRNDLLDELIDQMENSLAEKAYPSEKLAEEKTETAVEPIKSIAEPNKEDEELSEEDLAALEAVQKD